MPDASDPFEHCAALVRRFDKDRFLASLFIPEPTRRHVLALYAFNLEAARVRETISSPLPGEIRLQWWRDVLARGEASAHPVAAALLNAIDRFRLPLAPFTNLLDARIFDLYDDPMPSFADLEGYAGETSSALIQLAALILADGEDPRTHEASGHAGVAYAIVGLLRALPLHAARGQCYLPKDMLARHGAAPEDVTAQRATPGLLACLSDLRAAARAHLNAAQTLLPAVRPEARAAFLPIAFVEPYLKRLSRPRLDPFRETADLPSWRRPLIVWRAARAAVG